jgi:hypothetical protein
MKIGQILASSLFAALAASNLPAQTASQCRLWDAWATTTQAKLDTLLTGTDTINVALRQAMSVRRISTEQISFVTDPTGCRRAAEAMNVLVGTPGVGRRVYLWALGAIYGAFDPSPDREPMKGMFVFDFYDSVFVHIKSTMLPFPYSSPAPSRAVSQTSACYGSDSLSTAHLKWLDSLGTSSDSGFVALRNSLSIPATTHSNVALITTESLCRLAIPAVDSVIHHPGRTTRVYLYKIGSVFGVEDPSLVGYKGTEYRPLHFFSSTWTYLSFVMMY